LLDDYDKAIRPALSIDQPVAVKTNLYLSSIDELDGKLQLMSATGWLAQLWTDIQMTWTPSNYGGIRQIEVPINVLWHPDITVENTNNFVAPSEYEVAIVSSNGLIFWAQQASLQTRCSMDLSHFPFDRHVCNIDFASWAFDDTKIVFSNAPENDTYCSHLTGSEWSVTDCGVDIHSVYYILPNENLTAYQVLSYEFQLKRQTSFASHLFVAPSVSLCLITPMVFSLTTWITGENDSRCWSFDIRRSTIGRTDKVCTWSLSNSSTHR